MSADPGPRALLSLAFAPHGARIVRRARRAMGKAERPQYNGHPCPSKP